MRRQYRSSLPLLARFFPGWDWTQIDSMPQAEIDEFVHHLNETLDPA